MPQTVSVVRITSAVDLQYQPHSGVTYIVDTSEQVIIHNYLGNNTYKLTSYPNSLLVIGYFNTSNDRIDLTAFVTITVFSQLQITAGSVIVSLPKNQVVRVLNLHPQDVNSSCFVFYQESKIDDQKISLTVMLASIVGGIILLFVSLQCYISLTRRKCATKPFYMFELVDDTVWIELAAAETFSDDLELNDDSECNDSCTLRNISFDSELSIAQQKKSEDWNEGEDEDSLRNISLDSDLSVC